MKLIDKDALVAEIEKRINGLKDCHADTVAGYNREISGLKRLLSFINNLEVKEVDLEKEYDNEFFKDPVFGKLVNQNAGISIAKHFFKLAISLNNPITAADRGTAEEIIINLKRVEKDYRIDLTREMEWVRNKVKKGE